MNFMTWASLNLWARVEEGKIHACIIEALVELINSKTVNVEDEEVVVSGKLRPILYKIKKGKSLAWTLHPEASSFKGATDPKPYGHPDFRLSGNTAEYDQYDYDVECKLVRVKRKGKNWDYCEHYVVDGIKRFQVCKYAQSLPPMGTMIGYVQEGDIKNLLGTVNSIALYEGSNNIVVKGAIVAGGVTQMFQQLVRITDSFTLRHMWADLR